MNPLFFPVVALAALLFVAGYKAGMRPTGAGWLQYAVAAACALPATLLAVYYLHLFDDAVWFYGTSFFVPALVVGFGMMVSRRKKSA